MKQAKLVLWIATLVILIGVLTDYRDGLTAEASKYPKQDIICIVPYVPGGVYDTVARAAAPYIRKYLPQQVNMVVQNISAAGGRVGTFQVYDAKPDGYTIGQLDPLVFIVAEAMGELGKRDVTHMSWLPRVATTPFVMGVSPQSSIQNIGDLSKVKRIRAAVTQSTLAGNVAFLRHMGVEPQAIMYGGGAEACLAAMRGDVDLVITAGATVLRQAESSGGRLIAKGVFAENRISVAPNLPTAKELGVNVPQGILALMTFDAVFTAPPGLPTDVHKILNEAIGKMLHDPNFIKELENAKIPVAMLPPEEMQKRISEMAKSLPSYIEAIRQALPKVK